MTCLGCLDIKLQRSTCLCLRSSNYKSFLLQSLDFYVGAGDLNSIPYACRANALSTELFPQPLAFGFDFLLFLSFLLKHSPASIVFSIKAPISSVYFFSIPAPQVSRFHPYILGPTSQVVCHQKPHPNRSLCC